MIYDKAIYRNPAPYPTKNDFIQRWFYKQGEVSGPYSPKDTVCILSDWTEETVFDSVALSTARKQWQEIENAYVEKYKGILFEEEGTGNDEVNELLYAKAWSDSHSAGYGEVENTFIELVKLANKISEITKR